MILTQKSGSKEDQFDGEKIEIKNLVVLSLVSINRRQKKFTRAFLLQSAAVGALQEAGEAFLTDRMTAAALAAAHAQESIQPSCLDMR
jgi:hypothetical protein